MIKPNELDNLSNIEKENLKFRSFLKNNISKEELDKDFTKLHNKYYDYNYCKKCRRCCKLIGLSINLNEMNKLANNLNTTKEEIVKKYHLEKDNDNYISNGTCPFLNGNICNIESNRFSSCIEFPYTNKNDRMDSLLSIVSNSRVCPVVYHILEDLKVKYNFK